MNVTVCELPDDRAEFDQVWSSLTTHLKEHQSDVVLLPEMPGAPWFAHLPQFDEGAWQLAIDAHDELVATLAELQPAIVLGSRPVVSGDRRLNQAFSWNLSQGYRRVHEKCYLPDEEGFYEARWFDRGEDFVSAEVDGLVLGFLICTELMFTERARQYGKQGAHLIAAPRATGDHDRWLVAARMAAIASGAFVLSSNRTGRGPGGRDSFCGRGWVIGPDGDVLACTSSDHPFTTVDVDLSQAVSAKRSYPRYVAAEV